MNLKYKVGGVVASAALMLTLLAPKAFADTTLAIKDNGANSDNTIIVTSNQECNVVQKANTTAVVEVWASSNTGGNEASGNTGGNTTIDTGNATTTVNTNVSGGTNTATDPCCCQSQCENGNGTHSATIDNNGAGSTNTIVDSKSKSQNIKQKANTGALVGVGAKSKTGKNKANGNTGGTTLVKTGNANTAVGTTVTSGSNTLNP